MPWYPCDPNMLHWSRMTAISPHAQTRARSPLRGKGASHSPRLAIVSLIKRLFHNTPSKARKDHGIIESRSAANHKKHSIVSRMLRRPFLPYKKSPPPLVFTWSRPEFCFSDISDNSPCGSPALPDSPNLSPTWSVLQHSGEAPEPFVRPSAPEPFASSTSRGSVSQPFSSIYTQANSTIQLRVNRKSGKDTRPRAFTPLSSIKEEDGSSSQSQIYYQPVPIRIPRDILPIEEEEENELSEGVEDSNLLSRQRESVYPIGHEKLLMPIPLAAAVFVVTAPSDIEDEIYEGDDSLDDFPRPALEGSPDIEGKQPGLHLFNSTWGFKCSSEDVTLEYKISECLYDVDRSSPSLWSDLSDSSL